MIFSSIITPVFAPTFRIGDSSVPVEEGDFIVYGFEDNFAESLKLKVEFEKVFQDKDIIDTLVVNISISALNTTDNDYKVLIFDSIEFHNQTCMVYNKTHQYFIYGLTMNNLLIKGYGGYFIIPNDPVDVNIVKAFVDTYTAWSANITENTVIIDIANTQATLTYNKDGILIREEIRSNNLLISTLTLITTNEDLNIIGFDLTLFLVFIVVGIVMVIITKSHYRKHLYN
ncbi:MAG: hypothetical protein ACFE9R_16275 [Candidatus Hermodarchaeota archaeon]